MHCSATADGAVQAWNAQEECRCYALQLQTCSAMNRKPLSIVSSNVSPRMGLKGFHVRSLPGNGPMVNPMTHANLDSAQKLRQIYRDTKALYTA